MSKPIDENNPLSKSRNVDENGIERVWVTNGFGEPVNIKFENLPIALERGGKPIPPPEKQYEDRSATYTERATEAVRGFAKGVGEYGDLANTMSFGNLNKTVGNAADVVGMGAKKLGFDEVGKSADEFATEVRGEDFKWADKAKNIDALKTENRPDAWSEVMQAGGKFATDAPIFKGVGLALKEINIAVNGKAIVTPLLDKVTKFINTEQGVGALAVEFAGAGAGGELAKQSQSKDAGTVTKVFAEVIGTLVGSMSINAVSRKAASMFEQPVKLAGELIDVLNPTGLVKKTETLGGKLDQAKEFGSNVKEYAKDVTDVSPLKNLYLWLNSNKTLNPDLHLDKEAISTLKAKMKEVGVEPNVFSTFTDNKMSYVLASWLPHESIKKMMAKDKESFINYIEKTVDEGLGKLDTTAKTLGAEEFVGTKDYTSIMMHTDQTIKGEIKEFINLEMQRKNALYEDIDKIVNHSSSSSSSSSSSNLVSTQGLDYAIHHLLDKSFKAQVNDQAKEFVKNKLIDLAAVAQKNNYKMPLNEFVEQIKSLGALAYDPATLGNYKTLLYDVTAQMEQSLLNHVALFNGKELKNGSKILEKIKKARDNYSESYAPLMETDLVKAAEGTYPETTFKIMNSLQGVKEAKLVLTKLDKKNVEIHNLRKTAIESRPFNENKHDRIEYEIFKHVDLEQHAAKAPISLKDRVFRLKAEEMIQSKMLKDDVFDVDGFNKLFNDSDTTGVLKELLGMPTYRKIKDNLYPLSKKMQEILKNDANFGGGLTKPLKDASNINSQYSNTITFGTGAIAGGGGWTGAAVGTATLLTKMQLARSFAKAATDPRTVDRLIKLIEKGDDKQVISYLEKIYKSNALKYKALEGTVNEIKDNLPSKEKVRNVGKEMMKDGKEFQKTIGY